MLFNSNCRLKIYQATRERTAVWHKFKKFKIKSLSWHTETPSLNMCNT